MLYFSFAEGANRLVRRFEGRPAELITWVFRAAFSRDPLPEERAAAREFLGEQPAGPQVEDLLWSLVMQRRYAEAMQQFRAIVISICNTVKLCRIAAV